MQPNATTKRSGNPFSPEERARICLLGRKGLRVTEIVKATGRSRGGIVRLLVREDILAQKPGIRVIKFSESDDAYIREHYPLEGGKACATELSRHPSTIRSRAKRLGVTLRRKNLTHIKMTDAQVVEAVRLYEVELKCGAEIALIFGVKPDCIYDCLHTNGIKIRKGAFGARKRIPWTDALGRRFRMRSTWEIATAYWLDQAGVAWDYEVEAYSVNLEGGKTANYTPDFWTYDDQGELAQVIDVKGAARKSQIEKIRLLGEQQPGLPLTVWYYDDLVTRGILRGPREAPPILATLKEED